MDNYFFNCRESLTDVCSSLKEHLNTPNLFWTKRFGIQVCGVPRVFFSQYEKLDKFFTHFDVKRQGIFKFYPNTCYGWHVDNRGRTSALNMLIEGTDCHTFFGSPAVVKENDDYEHISEVKYEIGKFVLLNVCNPHTVINLNNTRYVLTISLDSQHKFEDIKQYLIDNNF
jgi:hypothetical protein